jgi:hypothetical protein
VPLRCQQELHAQGCLGVTADNSNLASVDNTSHSTAKMCQSTIKHYFNYHSQIKRFWKYVVTVTYLGVTIDGVWIDE